MTGDAVFVLRHERELDGYDTMIILGVYSDRSNAENAQARFAQEPGFRDHLDGFIIHPCKVDDDLWTGGFVTYRFPLAESE